MSVSVIRKTRSLPIAFCTDTSLRCHFQLALLTRIHIRNLCSFVLALEIKPGLDTDIIRADSHQVPQSQLAPKIAKKKTLTEMTELLASWVTPPRFQSKSQRLQVDV